MFLVIKVSKQLMHLPLTFLECCYTFTSLHLWCQQLLFRIWSFLNFWEKGKHIMLSSQEVLGSSQCPWPTAHGCAWSDSTGNCTRPAPWTCGLSGHKAVLRWALHVVEGSAVWFWKSPSMNKGPAFCALGPTNHVAILPVAATNKSLNQWSKCHFRIMCWDQAPTLRQSAC